MHDVERWAYAVPHPRGVTTLRPSLEAAGYRVAEEDPEAKALRFEAGELGGPVDHVAVLERPDLGVFLVQARGPGTVDRLGAVLEATGFVPQSELLGRAYSVGEPGAPAALTTLAHMIVAWDEDWADLFLLHLASPDPTARNEAVLSTVVAAFCAKARQPAESLLREALARETFPKLTETLIEAIGSVERI